MQIKLENMKNQKTTKPEGKRDHWRHEKKRKQNIRRMARRNVQQAQEQNYG